MPRALVAMDAVPIPLTPAEQSLLRSFCAMDVCRQVFIGRAAESQAEGCRAEHLHRFGLWPESRHNSTEEAPRRPLAFQPPEGIHWR
jgi:hypothetical protein